MCLCETFLGDLKTDKNKHIHWNKLPRKDREGREGIGETFCRIGNNGYSSLLQMVNVDIND